MLLIQNQKSDIEPIRGSLDLESEGDLPPAYDALSIHQSTNHRANQYAGPSASPSSSIAGPSTDPLRPNSARFQPLVLNIDKSLPPRPPPISDTPSPLNKIPSSFKDTLTSPRNASPALAQRPRARKNTSWLSLLPFVSSFSAKRVRQSVSSVVSNLVVPPSHVGSEEQKNVHEILASVAETCAEHKLSLSTILQETFIADHTPMYWAIVNYRQELLVALLLHARQLSVQTISDIRRACLVNSNQALFHALRVCHPPFHKTDGIQVPSLRTASDNLLLGNLPLDEIRIQQASAQGFVVSFEISLWQKRMKAIGQVDIEFIASGRMWSVTFFSTNPSSPTATSGKSRNAMNAWNVMVSLLESSSPTFFDSQLVVDVPPPLVHESIRAPKLRGARSTSFPASHDEKYQSRSSMYDHNYDGQAHSRLSKGRSGPASPKEERYPSQSSSRLPPPIHPHRGSVPSPRPSGAIPPPISIRLGSGDRKLCRRPGSGDSSKLSETPTTKPDTWSNHGVGYTNAAVSPLGEGLASHLLNDPSHSRYLRLDGTLRGRLEARFVKSESSKDCIIC